MKNDKAFLLDCWLNLYEHQSTPNPNMPLRHLFYVVREYAKLVDMSRLYCSTPMKVPTPRFVVFYNGKQKQPEKQTLKLSDLFLQPEEEPMLELTVDFMNINAGYNQELKDACESLKEYCLFVERVRQYAAGKDTPLEEAVNRAVEECIDEGILREFLIAHRGEVVAMSILECTLEDWIKVMEIEKEEGIAESHEKGLKALVTSLTPLLPDFEAVYKAVIANEEYKDYTKEQVEKYYQNQHK